MKLTINEKKALYAFGCTSRETTMKRLRWIAAITPQSKAAGLLRRVADKLEAANDADWYPCFFRTLQGEMEDYAEAETVMRLAETTCARLEDYLDEADKG